MSSSSALPPASDLALNSQEHPRALQRDLAAKKAPQKTSLAAGWLDEYQANAAHLAQFGLYAPEDEHDACGVGFVAAIDGKARREVVLKGIEALKALWHRGAVDADGKTGDGAGLHIQVPQQFFKDYVQLIGHMAPARDVAVGQVFLPRVDFEAQERCRAIVENEILEFGYYIYGWRQVPVNVAVIGEKANATRPEIEQIIIGNSKGKTAIEFEKELYLIRRRIEKSVRSEQISDFYICSLSIRSIIYKGMFLAEQLTAFYPDLLDDRFISNFALYHQRYSTNTFPSWPLAQPFRVLAHNGEINTLKGNANWMKAHETRMGHAAFGPYIDDIKPVIPGGTSDSGALDAVFEMLLRAGRDTPTVKTMLVPEAWQNNKVMPERHRDMYAYYASIMEPWDGPAALAIYGGRWIIGGLDRNGLRPMRYVVTGDNLLIVGSEAGMVKIDEQKVREKGRVGPGQMIGVDLEAGQFYRDTALKDYVSAHLPYGDWVKQVAQLDDLVKSAAAGGEPAVMSREELLRRQLAFGLTMEDMELILQPMVEDGKEAIGSMGDDTPLAILSERYRGLHHFFRQNFSQVTNPPIDSLRERQVMTLTTRLGNLGNILDQSEEQMRVLQLDSPVLTNGEYQALRQFMGPSAVVIDCSFTPQLLAREGLHEEDGQALKAALKRIRQQAEDAVRGGAVHLILTDEAQDHHHAAMPMILATAAVHTHLVRQNLRTFTSLNVRSGECLDTHYFAVLIGVGATTVNAYLAQEAIAERQRRGLFGPLTLEEAMRRYKTAIDDGLLKIMSKMGISVISSYRGGCLFEAVGLSRSMVAEHFPGMPSRISGIGLTGLTKKLYDQHQVAYGEDNAILPVGGFYRYRHKGERHAYEAELIHLLQSAVSSGSFASFRKFSEAVNNQKPIYIRHLLDFKPKQASIGVEEVESITEIRKRFVTPGMSLGALSPEAHGTLNVAMNRIGAKSDSGEGGEDPQRFRPDKNGDNWNSAIKQVASGRFGVTAEYLNQCREIEIKVAQGAKPGEGGQLPGFKVTEMIAKLRHSTPGVMLISPPPHHDIYSIEDLAQLIYDLKQINPIAKICVKLVARSGIGTIAAGVAKANADVILISGHVGGTGASPQTSIKFAGLPWEMGLAEAHQVLTLNRLRHRVKLRTDGGLRTGRDIVIAAMLGAEEYGIGTAALVAMGCIMVRQCHSNTCPVGVCVQDESLRQKFTGTPEKVVNLFSFIAEEVRETLAYLGFRSLNEVIGRTDLLHQINRGHDYLDDLDLNPLLTQADPGDHPVYCTLAGRNEVPDTLDAQMIADARPLFEDGEKMQLAYNVRNSHRTIGARLSSNIVRKFGMTGLNPGHLTVRLKGTAGQSLGAFAVQGLKIEVHGDANDYVGKGLSGGTIIVRPMNSSPLVSHENVIIGNTVLYGATAGKLFAAGQAGERFAVRNSGAITVVEGCGANGCEYMTGGIAVILGAVGDNFAAGMTGGMAYVYDPQRRLPQRINLANVLYQPIEVTHYEQQLHQLIEEHVRETKSHFAAALLNDWQRESQHFWQIIPREMLDRLTVLPNILNAAPARHA
jgi:glutamate synthase (NADPH) large chain